MMRVLHRGYEPALRAALRHRGVTVGTAGLLFVTALGLARGIGSEFMPPLNEGDLMFMPIADPSISLEENTRNAIDETKSSSRSPRGGLRGGEGRARRHVD